MIEIYMPDDEEQKQKVFGICRVVVQAMDSVGPVSYDIGLNALIVVIASAIKNTDKSYEHKVKLARTIGEAIIINMYPNGAPN